MKEFWNERYAVKEYVYGEEPIDFLKKELPKLKLGKILLPADGEGRNSVFAAKLGWDVTAFDYSKEAQKKALALAEKNNVKINYTVDDALKFQTNERFDCIGFFFTHQTSDIRPKFHKKMVQFLKEGGLVILECFNKEQINNDSGGPKSEDMLYSKEEIKEDFKELKTILLEDTTRNITPGLFHGGKANIIRFIGQKID